MSCLYIFIVNNVFKITVEMDMSNIEKVHVVTKYHYLQFTAKKDVEVY